MGASQCGNDRPGFGVPSISQKLRANNCKRFSGFLNKKIFCSVRFLSLSPVSNLNAGEWCFVLIPDRSTRLICHRCCFKSWINELYSFALKFQRLFAFSRPLYDLPLRGSWRATF
jgi:hypothetical protein